jgi:hypothetical protein
VKRKKNLHRGIQEKHRDHRENVFSQRRKDVRVGIAPPWGGWGVDTELHRGRRREYRTRINDLRIMKRRL